MKDYEKNYNEFWKEIVENKDGTINKDQLMKELHDFSYLIHNLGKLYCRISGGITSKPMTNINVILNLYEDALEEQYDNGYSDGYEDGNL